MTTYTRTHAGHAMTVHAPRPGELDRAALAAFAAAEPVLGLDAETSHMDDDGPRHFAPGFTVRLVQFGSQHQAWVLNLADPAQRDAAAAVLADPAQRFVTHTNYDPLAVWAAFGIALGQRAADTHLLSKLASPDERAGHGLKQLAERHLDGGLSQAQDALYARMRQLAPPGQRAGNTWQRWGWNHIPADDETYVVYAGLDAVYARRLLPVLLTACAPFAHLAPIETWLAAQATGITVRGLQLDKPYTRGLLDSLQAEHRAADSQITAALGCPGGSPKFAGWLDTHTAAAGIGGLARTPTGRLQVTSDALTALLNDHAAALPAEVAGLVRARLAMSRTSNLIGNLRGFLTAADPAGRVHPQVKTLRAKTARMSITGPPLQTLKKHDPRLRRCFAADPGHVLISCDFSQVEIRVAAALSGDTALQQVIASGADIHDATAQLMYGPGFSDEQRTISKRATFGTIFGGGAHALATQTGVSEDVAREVIARWRRTYPQVAAYGRRMATLAEVVTPSGRRIPADPARPYANANYPVQSTARDLLLAAVYRLVTRHHVGGLWLFIHDEIIVQAPERDAERVRGLLERAMTSTFRGLPIVADAKILGPSWGQHDPAAPVPGTCEPANRRPPRHDPKEEVMAGTPLERRVLVVRAIGPGGSRQPLGGGGVGEAGAAQLAHDATTIAVDERLSRPVQTHIVQTASADQAVVVHQRDGGFLSHASDRSPAARRAELLEAALWCAARGWPVFPIRPGSKQPAFPDHKAGQCTGTDRRCRSGHTGWEPRATTDPDRIRRGWAQVPYNVGIATGPSGLIVIDLDKPKPGEAPPPEWAEPGITDGADVLAALCERHGQDFPWETFLVRTRRGGLHLYFTAPPGTRLGNTSGRSPRGLGWLIDTRGHGGQVVAPGSYVDLPDGAGHYEVGYDRPPAPLPGWLATLLTSPPVDSPPVECGPPAARIGDLPAYAAEALHSEISRVVSAPAGGHNWALNKAAFNLGRLIGGGALDRAQAEHDLLAAAQILHWRDGETPARLTAVIRAGIGAGIRQPRHLPHQDAA